MMHTFCPVVVEADVAGREHAMLSKLRVKVEISESASMEQMIKPLQENTDFAVERSCDGVVASSGEQHSHGEGF